MCTRRRSSVGRRASSLPIVLSKNLARLHTPALRGPFLLPKIDLANFWNSSVVNGSLIAARLLEDDGSCTLSLLIISKEDNLVYKNCGYKEPRRVAGFSSNQVLGVGDSLLFPYGVSSAQQGLTSLFGMGRGVAPATNHQH